MTTSLRPLSLCAALICGLSVSACTSTPQNGVVATDMTGAFSQMWSNVFTGELRRAPQAEYSFSGNDATLNTPLLMSRVANQAASAPYYQPNYINNSPQMYRSEVYRPAAQQTFQRAVYQQPVYNEAVQTAAYEPAFEPQAAQQLSPENPWSRRQASSPSLDSYESFQPKNYASLPPAQDIMPHRPAQSQPVMADSYTQRDAYPVEAPAEKTASYAPAAAQDWQSANQEIGDNLSYVKIGGGSDISDWQSCEAQAGSYFLTTASGFIVAPKFDVCMRSKGYKPEAEAQAELAVSAG